jgi:Flp pilus assembly protein TadB
VVGALGFGAMSGASALLARRRERVKRRESILTERAKGLQTMVREAQEVSRELELYLEERLAALQELSEKVDNQERLAALTPEQVEALNKILRQQFTGSRRSGLIQQIVFLVLAFLLGFVVNWLSGPLLEIVERWWS